MVHITGFKDLPQTEDALHIAVTTQPISVAIEADHPSFKFYKTGVMNDLKCGTRLNHAVLLVGFGTDPKQGDYWIVKNSWGKKWGDKGYIKMARNTKSRYGTCGIAMKASYPTLDDTIMV